MPQHLQTKLVAIERLDLPYNQDLEYFGYIESQIERGAELFLKAGGFINPLVVKRTNNVYNGVVVEAGTPHDRYEVRSSFLEYFCAVRAKEINPAQEFVQAIIMDNSLEDNLIKQIELFRIGAETVEPDEFWGDDKPDFELVDDEMDRLDDEMDRLDAESLDGKSEASCYAAAERLCNLYPDKEDRNKAIAELESILKHPASGNRTYQERLDHFFAEAAEMYE